MAFPVDAEDQEALIDLLGDLVTAKGAVDLLHRPLLLATPEFFPDAWRADGDGARLMLQRMLAWVRLGERPFELTVVDLEDEPPMISFVGERDGALCFEVEVTALPAAEVFAGALCREVARAWLTVHSLGTADEGLSEVFVDVAAVFLGAGVLTTNTSYVYRVEGDYRSTRYSVTRVGALEPAEFTFLLGVLLRARDHTGEVERVLPHLERAQREMLEEVLGFLPPGETLRRWLHIAAFGQALPAPSLPPVVTSLPPTQPGRSRAEPQSYSFRHAKARWIAAFLLATAAGLLVASLLQTPWPLVLGVLGWVLAQWWTYDVCTECNCLVLPAEETCAACGALLVGRFSEGHREIEPRHLARVEELKRVVAERERLAREDEAALERTALDPPG